MISNTPIFLSFYVLISHINMAQISIIHFKRLYKRTQNTKTHLNKIGNKNIFVLNFEFMCKSF